MEKRGSHYLRFALINATSYVCHWDETFSAFLQKKISEGKHYNIAITHATKKLVQLIYAMENSGKPYIKTTWFLIVSLSINEMAFQCGFKDSSYFVKLFRW